MIFRDIKQGYPVYIFNKQELTISQGKVASAGFPRLDTNPMSGKTEMVIDITVDDGSGKTGSYVIPEGLSVTYAGNLVLATEKAALAGEVEAMKSSAEQALASVDRQREILDKATALLSDLNPAYRERQETEKRFCGIENSVNELKDMFRSYIEKQEHKSGV